MVAGLAMMAPLYLLLHLTLSTTSSKPTTENVWVKRVYSNAILCGILLGYVLPTIVMSLPTPSLISPETKMNAVMFWQGSPLWAIIIAAVWVQIASSLCGTKSINKEKSPLTISQEDKDASRSLYLIAITVGAVTNVAALSLSICSAICPNVFATSVVDQLSLLNLLVPPIPNSNIQMHSFIQGATWFIQWDYAMVSIAYLVWGLAMRHSVPSSKYSMLRGNFVIKALLCSLRVIVLGPVAAALSFVWERDEALWAVAEPPASDPTEKKRSRKH